VVLIGRGCQVWWIVMQEGWMTQAGAPNCLGGVGEEGNRIDGGF